MIENIWGPLNLVISLNLFGSPSLSKPMANLRLPPLGGRESPSSLGPPLSSFFLFLSHILYLHSLQVVLQRPFSLHRRDSLVFGSSSSLLVRWLLFLGDAGMPNGVDDVVTDCNCFLARSPSCNTVGCCQFWLNGKWDLAASFWLGRWSRAHICSVLLWETLRRWISASFLILGSRLLAV